jgi:hypothetical protein
MQSNTKLGFASVSGEQLTFVLHRDANHAAYALHISKTSLDNCRVSVQLFAAPDPTIVDPKARPHKVVNLANYDLVVLHNKVDLEQLGELRQQLLPCVENYEHSLKCAKIDSIAKEPKILVANLQVLINHNELNKLGDTGIQDANTTFLLHVKDLMNSNSKASTYLDVLIVKRRLCFDRPDHHVACLSAANYNLLAPPRQMKPEWWIPSLYVYCADALVVNQYICENNLPTDVFEHVWLATTACRIDETTIHQQTNHFRLCFEDLYLLIATEQQALLARLEDKVDYTAWLGHAEQFCKMFDHAFSVDQQADQADQDSQTVFAKFSANLPVKLRPNLFKDYQNLFELPNCSDNRLATTVHETENRQQQAASFGWTGDRYKENQNKIQELVDTFKDYLPRYIIVEHWDAISELSDVFGNDLVGLAQDWHKHQTELQEAQDQLNTLIKEQQEQTAATHKLIVAEVKKQVNDARIHYNDLLKNQWTTENWVEDFFNTLKSKSKFDNKGDDAKQRIRNNVAQFIEALNDNYAAHLWQPVDAKRYNQLLRKRESDSFERRRREPNVSHIAEEDIRVVSNRHLAEDQRYNEYRDDPDDLPVDPRRQTDSPERDVDYDSHDSHDSHDDWDVPLDAPANLSPTNNGHDLFDKLAIFDDALLNNRAAVWELVDYFGEQELIKLAGMIHSTNKNQNIPLRAWIKNLPRPTYLKYTAREDTRNKRITNNLEAFVLCLADRNHNNVRFVEPERPEFDELVDNGLPGGVLIEHRDAIAELLDIFGDDLSKLAKQLLYDPDTAKSFYAHEMAVRAKDKLSKLNKEQHVRIDTNLTAFIAAVANLSDSHNSHAAGFVSVNSRQREPVSRQPDIVNNNQDATQEKTSTVSSRVGQASPSGSTGQPLDRMPKPTTNITNTTRPAANTSGSSAEIHDQLVKSGTADPPADLGWLLDDSNDSNKLVVDADTDPVDWSLNPSLNAEFSTTLLDAQTNKQQQTNDLRQIERNQQQFSRIFGKHAMQDLFLEAVLYPRYTMSHLDVWLTNVKHQLKNTAQLQIFEKQFETETSDNQTIMKTRLLSMVRTFKTRFKFNAGAKLESLKANIKPEVLQSLEKAVKKVTAWTDQNFDEWLQKTKFDLTDEETHRLIRLARYWRWSPPDAKPSSVSDEKNASSRGNAAEKPDSQRRHGSPSQIFDFYNKIHDMQIETYSSSVSKLSQANTIFRHVGKFATTYFHPTQPYVLKCAYNEEQRQQLEKEYKLLLEMNLAKLPVPQVYEGNHDGLFKVENTYCYAMKYEGAPVSDKIGQCSVALVKAILETVKCLYEKGYSQYNLQASKFVVSHNKVTAVGVGTMKHVTLPSADTLAVDMHQVKRLFVKQGCKEDKIDAVVHQVISDQDVLQAWNTFQQVGIGKSVTTSNNSDSESIPSGTSRYGTNNKPNHDHPGGADDVVHNVGSSRDEPSDDADVDMTNDYTADEKRPCLYDAEVDHEKSQKALDDILSGKHSAEAAKTKLFCGAEHLVWIKDMLVLKPGTWLNDAIIKSFLNLITLPANHAIADTLTKDFILLHPYINIKSDDKKVAPNITKVFMPINETRYHWYFLIFDKQLNTVTVCDSLTKKDQAHVAELVAKIVKHDYLGWHDWEYNLIFEDSYPQQDNGISCGVFVAIGIWRKVLQLGFDKEYTDFDNFEKKFDDNPKRTYWFGGEYQTARNFIGRSLLEQRIHDQHDKIPPASRPVSNSPSLTSPGGQPPDDSDAWSASHSPAGHGGRSASPSPSKTASQASDAAKPSPPVVRRPHTSLTSPGHYVIRGEILDYLL